MTRKPTFALLPVACLAGVFGCSCGHDEGESPPDAAFPEVPAAPSGLTATARSSSTIDLAWNDNSTNETAFEVERAVAAAGPFALVTVTGAGEAMHAENGLAASTTYYYRVRATNSAGDSAYTAIASATTQVAPRTAPPAPSGLTAAATSSSTVQLGWTDNSNDESGFKVERATAVAGPFVQVATTSVNITDYADTGLAASTIYYYRVRGTSNAGDSAYTAVASATTQAPPVTVPPAPSGLTATGTSSSTIQLRWTDNSNNESGFNVERAAAAAGPYVQIATTSANITNYADTGLAASTTYYYRVRGTNSAGDSAYTAVASATTQAPPVTVPPAPSGLTATATSSSTVELGWTDNSNSETGFKVERTAAAAGPFVEIATTSANITNYADSGLGASTTYHYRLRATNGAGDSAYSNTVPVTTLPLSSYLLTVSIAGGGVGRVTGPGIDCGDGASDCSESFPSGTSVTVTANPAAGATFGTWSGCDSTSERSCNVTMAAARRVVASFDISTTITLADISSPDADGNYTISWTTSGLASSAWAIQEAPNASFTSVTGYISYDATSPFTYSFSGKPDGTYCYRVGLSSSGPYSAPQCVTVARPTTATLRVVNASRYDIIDLRANGHQAVEYPYAILPGTSADFTFAAGGTVNVAGGTGFYTSSGSRDLWFTFAGTATVTPGQVTTVSVPSPTIGQLLSGFAASRRWDGVYYCYSCPTLVHTASFVFTSAGGWNFYDDGIQRGTGTVTLVAWPNYSPIVTFKLCPSCDTIQLAYPFASFLFGNGPVDWPIIEYVAQ